MATVDVGTNGGTAWTRPSTVPARSATALVTSYVYNAAGWVQDTIDPDGLDTRDYYNALGEVTETIQNYTGNAETDDSDVATEYSYDGNGNVTLVTAEEPGGGVQETAYVYGVTTSQGSNINSNDLLYAVEQPNATTGLPSASDETTSTYNSLGQVTSSTDANGTTHQYTYDVLGRLTADAVTTLGAGVNGSVLRIEYAYDAQGNQYLITTYDAASGGNIVNQVERLYNGLGQLTAEYQSVSGAVTIGSTPVVQYLYTELSDGNNSRLTNIIYPDGYTVDYNYGTTGGLNDTISRLDSISDDTGTLQSYQYLGLDTVVQMDDPQAGVELTYLSQTGSTGDAGDQYTGLDRFGRVVDQNWYDTNTDTSVDEEQYGYDPDGNVLYEVNTGNTSVSQLYSNNGLGELTSYQQGTLNSSDTALAGTASASQSWTLDALGNWTSVTSNGTQQTNTANQDNQYTAIGSATPGYDANGNLTQDENGQQYVYNAWNQLVLVEDSFGNGLAAYSYNGLGECVIQTDGSTETALYYSSAGQVLEEQVGGVTQARNVWSPVYVNALIVRDQSSQGNGDLDQRLYALQDANWNVTALVNASGSVVEQYVYTPYGQVSIYDSSWNPLSNSNYNWNYLYQGGRLDPASGMYKFGARDYDPADGRWLEQDPLGLIPDNNDYRFVNGNPILAVDPTGLERWVWPWDPNAVWGWNSFKQGYSAAVVSTPFGEGLVDGEIMIINAATFHQNDAFNTYVNNAIQQNGYDYRLANVYAHLGVVAGYSAGGAAAAKQGAKICAAAARNTIPNAARTLVAQAEQRYPALAGRWQWHHTWPFEFGPPPNVFWQNWPNTVQLPAAYHQVITNEIRAGLQALGPNPTQSQLWQLLQSVYTRFPINGFLSKGAGAW